MTISVAPSLVEMSATPGGTGALELTVYNEGSEAFSVETRVATYKDGTGDLSAVDWVQAEPLGFELQPGEQQRVRVTVRVPRDLQSGGRYTAVTFTTGPVAAQAQATPIKGQATLSGRIGIPLLLTVQGEGALRKQAAIERIAPILGPNCRLGFQVFLANQGNVHVFANGRLSIERENGPQMGDAGLPETTAILPGSTEIMVSRGEFELQPGRYLARATVDYGGTEPAINEAVFSPVPDLEIQGLSARETPGRGVELRLRLANRGEVGLLPQVQLSVGTPDGRELATLNSLRPGLMLPGAQAEIVDNYPGHLGPGDYLLTARVGYGCGEPQVQQVPFRLTSAAAGQQAINVPDGEWVSQPGTPATGGPAGQAPRGRHLLCLPALVAVAVLGIALLLLAWLPALAPLRRRLQRAACALRGRD